MDYAYSSGGNRNRPDGRMGRMVDPYKLRRQNAGREKQQHDKSC